MNKEVKDYIIRVKETLMSKYNMDADSARFDIIFSHMFSSLVKPPYEGIHNDVEVVADKIYNEWIERRRWLYELLYLRCTFISCMMKYMDYTPRTLAEIIGKEDIKCQ